MQKSNIEWCDYTWNPVTGCLHGCEYCYARTFANRFGGHSVREVAPYGYPHDDLGFVEAGEPTGELHEVEWPQQIEREKVMDMRPAPYPYYFDPTLHCYRLNEPQAVKKPQKVFVCSMSDLFGEWVPDSWIEAVFEACAKAPWHKYLFLTKNPKRYVELSENNKLPKNDNFWYGITITNQEDESKISGCKFTEDWHDGEFNMFYSIEPLLGPIDFIGTLLPHWIILGGETGNRKNKITPSGEWIKEIAMLCSEQKIPLLCKDSLKPWWNIKEYPEGLK